MYFMYVKICASWSKTSYTVNKFLRNELSFHTIKTFKLFHVKVFIDEIYFKVYMLIYIGTDMQPPGRKKALALMIPSKKYFSTSLAIRL